jgi:hypothetical protein
MRHYFRRKSRGFRADQFDAWGSCEFFFEIGEDGACLRQLERYQNGFVLKYDPSHQEDEYGAIAGAVTDLHDLWEFEITEAEFENEWRASAINRTPREEYAWLRAR